MNVYDREHEKKIAEVVKKAKANDGFDLDEHAYDMDPVINPEWNKDEELDKIIEQHQETYNIRADRRSDGA